MKYSFCERATATATSPWHIRQLTSTGKKTGGGADTKALCGQEVAWDLDKEVPIQKLYADAGVCPNCTSIYNMLLVTGPDVKAAAERITERLTKMTKQEELSGKGAIAAILCVPFNAAILAAISYRAYNWFVLPLTHLQLSKWHLYGLVVFITMLTKGFQSGQAKTDRQVFVSELEQLLVYLTLWLIFVYCHANM